MLERKVVREWQEGQAKSSRGGEDVHGSLHVMSLHLHVAVHAHGKNSQGRPGRLSTAPTQVGRRADRRADK